MRGEDKFNPVRLKFPGHYLCSSSTSTLYMSTTVLFRFNRKYFLFAIVLFIVEVCIAKYAHDAIVRPYVGDLLVVILLYCMAKSILNTDPYKTAIAVLFFAYFIELLQYLQIIKWLGLEHNALARTIIGTSFEWIDMMAYTIGTAIVIICIKIFSPKGEVDL